MSCRCTSGERGFVTLWAERWVDPSAGLDTADKRKSFTFPGIRTHLLRSVFAIQSTLIGLRRSKSALASTAFIDQNYLYIS
jgi:hypothetical protein